MNLPQLGTVIRASRGVAGEITRLAPHGFESWQIAWSLKRDTIPPLAELAREISPLLERTGTVVSALGIYGNPLRTDALGEESRRALREAFSTAALFGTSIVACFAGRVPGAAVDACIPRFTAIWSELVREAAEEGVRVAFENCLQGGTWESGDWNIAHNPDAWELIFDAVPSSTLGLEWEPAHQMCQCIDPMQQLARWAPRIFHIHGKDANVDRDMIVRHGVYGRERFAWHRLPGFGDCNWAQIFTLLSRNGFTGNVDIEGFHDPVYKEEREYEGQILALKYLRECRASAAGEVE